MMSLPKEVSWQGRCDLKLPEVKKGAFLALETWPVGVLKRVIRKKRCFGSKIFEENL